MLKIATLGAIHHILQITISTCDKHFTISGKLQQLHMQCNFIWGQRQPLTPWELFEGNKKCFTHPLELFGATWTLVHSKYMPVIQMCFNSITKVHYIDLIRQMVQQLSKSFPSGVTVRGFMESHVSSVSSWSVRGHIYKPSERKCFFFLLLLLYINFNNQTKS